MRWKPVQALFLSTVVLVSCSWLSFAPQAERVALDASADALTLVEVRHILPTTDQKIGNEQSHGHGGKKFS
jgi:hypothetical protein